MKTVARVQSALFFQSSGAWQRRWHFRAGRPAVSLAAALAFAAIPTARAQLWNYSVGNWAQPAYWSPASVPGSGGFGGVASIENGGEAQITSSVPFLSIVSIGSSSGSLGGTVSVLEGASLAIASATIIGTQASGTLNIGSFASGGNAGTLTLAGSSVSLGVDGLINFNQSNNFTFAGNLTSAAGGNGSIVQRGTGTTFLTGDNSGYSGAVAVNAGTLSVGNGGTTGTLPVNVSVASGATLAFNRSNDFSYSGVVSGAGVLSKTGSGVLTLSGINTYSGGTAVSGGVLTVTNNNQLGAASAPVTLRDGGTLRSIGITMNRAFTLASGAGVIDSTLAGVGSAIHGTVSGSGSLLKTGIGDLTLSNANNAYSGGTTVTGGRLSVYQDQNLGQAGTTLTLNGGGLQLLILFGNTTTTIDRPITLGASGGTLEAGATATLDLPGVLGGAGALTKNGVGTVILRGANTYTGGTTISAGTLQIGGGSTTGAIAGNITNNAALVFNRSDNLSFAGNISGTGSLTKLGAGQLSVSGNNSYSGNTTISAGTLKFTLQNSLYAASQANWGKLTVAAGAIAAFNVGGNSEFVTSQISALTGLSTAATGFLSGSTLALDTSNATGQNFVHSFAIPNPNGGANTLAFLKLGSNRLTLAADNTYTGGTTISAGSLQIGNGGTTGSVAGDIVNNAALVFNRSDDLTFSGQITGNGSVTKQGAGVLQLGNGGQSLSDTAPLIVSAGTVRLGNANEAIGSLSGTSGNIDLFHTVGHTLTVNQTTDGAFFGNLSGAGGSLAKIGSGKLTLAGTNTFTGSTTVSNGTLQIGIFDGIHYGDTTFTGDIVNQSLIVFAPTNFMTYSGRISGSGAVRIDQGLTLAGENTYAGTTTITAGITEITGSVAGNISNAGVLWWTRATDFTYGGKITSTGNFNKRGVGELTFTGSGHNFSLLEVDEGTLRLHASASSSFTGIGQSGAGGTLSLGGTGSTFTLEAVNVGRNAPGTLVVDSGAGATGTDILIGADYTNSTAPGFVRVTGTGSTLTHTGSLSVGGPSPGELRIEAGGQVLPSSPSLPAYVSGKGHAFVRGAGSLWNVGAGAFQVASPGSLTIADGGAVVSTTSSITITGTLNIGESDLSATAGTISDVPIYLATSDATINFNQTDSIAFPNDFSESSSGRIVQRGTGTTILSGNSPLAFVDISIQNGTLAATTASLGYSTIKLEGGTFATSGIDFAAPLNLRGLTVTSGTLAFDIASAALYDRIAFLDNNPGAMLSGGTLRLTLLAGYEPMAGDTFDLFDWGVNAPFTGAFANFDLPSGITWDTTNLYTNGTISVLAVPEPPAIALFLTGGVVIVFVARRQISRR